MQGAPIRRLPRSWTLHAVSVRGESLRKFTSPESFGCGLGLFSRCYMRGPSSGELDPPARVLIPLSIITRLEDRPLRVFAKIILRGGTLTNCRFMRDGSGPEQSWGFQRGVMYPETTTYTV